MAALAAVVVLFVVLAGSGDDKPAAEAAQPQPARGATGRESDARATSAQLQRTPGRTGGRSRRQTPTIERIVVRDGKVVGGVERLEYASGERVRFSVHSDVADEVHVHGFDVEKEVPANGTVRLGFLADVEGVFEVELEDSDVTIAELRVEP